MAVTIENGTGVTGADSFITASEFDAISLAYLGHSETGSTASKEAALRRAFLFMRSLTWREEYPWPTMGGTIPADIKTAQGIFGHYEAKTPNSLAPTVVAGSQKVLNKVGELGWQVMGQTGVEAQRASVLMAIDLLKDYTFADTGTSFLLRG